MRCVIFYNICYKTIDNYRNIRQYKTTSLFPIHDHVCRLWRITCCTITGIKILCPIVLWWIMKFEFVIISIYLERRRILIKKIHPKDQEKSLTWATLFYWSAQVKVYEKVWGIPSSWHVRSRLLLIMSELDLCVDKNGFVRLVIMNET